MEWKWESGTVGESRWKGGIAISRRSVPRDAKVSAILSIRPRIGFPSVRLSRYM